MLLQKAGGLIPVHYKEVATNNNTSRDGLPVELRPLFCRRS